MIRVPIQCFRLGNITLGQVLYKKGILRLCKLCSIRVLHDIYIYIFVCVYIYTDIYSITPQPYTVISGI